MLRPRYPLQFFVALVAAFALWYVQATDRLERISEKRLAAPLTLANIPPDIVVTSPIPGTVSVGLRGPLSVLRNLEGDATFDVVLDLAGYPPGPTAIPIRESDIELPNRVSVMSLDPAEIELELERLERRMVPLEPMVEGTPAEGHRIERIRLVPPAVPVVGPPSALDQIDDLETTPVSVEGRTESLVQLVRPRVPIPLLRPAGPSEIQLTVDIVAEEPPPSDTGEEDLPVTEGTEAAGASP